MAIAGEALSSPGARFTSRLAKRTQKESRSPCDASETTIPFEKVRTPTPLFCEERALVADLMGLFKVIGS
jgi:hypothetical protein